MLLGFPLGITGVKGVNLDPELSLWCKYCYCSAVVISTIIMSSLILLCISAAPPCNNPLSTIGSKPLACIHLSGSTKAGTLSLCTPMSLSPSIFPTSAIRYWLPHCPLVKAWMTVLIAWSCLAILFTHVWVHAAPKDAALTLGERRSPLSTISMTLTPSKRLTLFEHTLKTLKFLEAHSALPDISWNNLKNFKTSSALSDITWKTLISFRLVQHCKLYLNTLKETVLI